MSSSAHTIDSPRVPPVPVATSGRERRRLDWFELLLLAALGAVSLWVLALNLWHQAHNGMFWTGADGFWGIDQYQYMAWISDASKHVLVSNLFVLRSTPHDYFQPAIAISGAISALGVAPSVSFLLWKPVAVAVTFFAARAYAYRILDDRWARRAALALILFFGSFTYVYGSISTIGDLFPGFLAWGYPFALVGLAAMVGGVVLYDRARREDSRGWWAGGLGALASLLHPWNGTLLIAAVVGGELFLMRARPKKRSELARPALVVALTALPIGYYFLLGHFDLSWRLAKIASKHTYPLWPIVVELVPLLVPALVVYRRRPKTFLIAASMAWPLAAFLLYAMSTTSFAATPVHAFQGITFPLSVLAVEGLRRVGFSRLPYKPVVATILVAGFTLPGTIYQMSVARRYVQQHMGNANFITKDEHRAMRYLANDPRPGGVMARLYLGQLVPALTGRQTFVGDCLWSEPGCISRQIQVHALFFGQMTHAQALAFVRSQHPRFLLSDCRPSVPLNKLLGDIIVSVHHFGCATVYDVD
jgi:hypothetical protein